MAKKSTAKKVTRKARTIPVTNGASTRAPKAETPAIAAYKPIAILQAKYANEAGRGAKRLAKIETFGLPDETIVDLCRKVTAAQEQIAAKLAALPADWRPARGSMTTPITPGSLMTLSEKGAETWKDILDPSAEVEVVKFVKNRVLVKYNETLIPVLRTHLVRAVTDAAAQ